MHDVGLTGVTSGGMGVIELMDVTTKRHTIFPFLLADFR